MLQHLELCPCSGSLERDVVVRERRRIKVARRNVGERDFHGVGGVTKHSNRKNTGVEGGRAADPERHVGASALERMRRRSRGSRGSTRRHVESKGADEAGMTSGIYGHRCIPTSILTSILADGLGRKCDCPGWLFDSQRKFDGVELEGEGRRHRLGPVNVGVDVHAAPEPHFVVGAVVPGPLVPELDLFVRQRREVGRDEGDGGGAGGGGDARAARGLDHDGGGVGIVGPPLDHETHGRAGEVDRGAVAGRRRQFETARVGADQVQVKFGERLHGGVLPILYRPKRRTPPGWWGSTEEGVYYANVRVRVCRAAAGLVVGRAVRDERRGRRPQHLARVAGVLRGFTRGGLGRDCGST